MDAVSETDGEEGDAWGWDDHQGDGNAAPSAADAVEGLQEFQIFVTPRCDVPFDLMQLDRWREIESSLGIKDSKGSPTKSRTSTTPKIPPELQGGADVTFAKCRDFAGMVAGFVFKLGDQGLGYYNDLIPPQLSTVIRLSELIPATGEVPSPTVVTRPAKRARRPRNKDGSRLRRPTRRQCANTWRGPHRHPDATQFGEMAWKRQGLCALDTVNPNCWESLTTKALPRSAADVLFTQESKLHRDDSRCAAELAARSAGWNPCLSMALATAAEAASGGCGVLARRGVGIRESDHSCKDGMQHRLCLAWVSGIIRGGIHCLSIYLKSGEGMSEANKAILEEAAVLLGLLKGPWIVAGDFNVNPEDLAATRWVDIVDGVLFAPALPTCTTATSSNKYDYFVVHRSIAHAVVAVQRIEDGACKPHWPARLLIKSNARRMAVRKLVRAKKVPGTLPFGPPPTPQDYSKVHSLVAHQSMQQTSAAATEWYTLARKEWSAIAGEDLAYAPPRFKWAEAAGSQLARPWAGASATSVLWRSLARRAQEAGNILARDPSALTALQSAELRRHPADAERAVTSLCNTQRPLVKPLVVSWARSLTCAITAQSVRWALSLAHLAETRAKHLEQTVATCRKREWQVKIGARTSEGGKAMPTKLAHRWVKGLAGWMPSPVGELALKDEDEEGIIDDGVPLEIELENASLIGATSCSGRGPLSDQATVEQQANDWAEIWQEEASYCEPDFGDLRGEQLAPLWPWAIIEAVSTFPVGTGLGADNVAPRALRRLSEAAIVALIALFLAFEAAGSWAAALNLVLIVLLPKGEGAFRTIGLFPTPVRVWMRARTFTAKAWEAANTIPGVFGGCGMGAQRAAWEEAMMAEAAALQHLDLLQMLYDLVKAFETVPHGILVECAKECGYNLTILRLSLAAYRLVRSLGVEGVFSRLIQATRGITAGSVFATTELRVLLHKMMLRIRAKWGDRLRSKLYVDDLSLSAVGHGLPLALLQAEVSDFVVWYFETILKMIVSVKKSVVLANTLRLAKLAALQMKVKKLRPVKAAKLLGTGVVGGRRRTTKVLQGRLKAFKKYAHRFHRLRAAGTSTLGMVRAIGPPSVLYGVETMGLASTALYNTRTAFAKAGAPQAGGKNPDAVLYFLDGTTGTLDAAFEAHTAPVKHWALAWWDNWFHKEILEMAFQGAALKLAVKEEDSWARVAGPVTALIVSLGRIGWVMPSAIEAIDDLGYSWNFLLDSPARILCEVRASVRRWRFARLGKTQPALIPGNCDVGAPSCPQGTVVVEFASTLTSNLRSKKAVVEDVVWDSAAKAGMVSAASGGQWPQARKVKVARWNLTDNRCQLCLAAVGTEEHRFCCSATRPVGGWPAAPKAAARCLGRLSSDRKRLLQTRGLLALRLPAPPPHPGEWFRWARAPPEDLPEEAVWYLDGSLVHGQWRQFRATGFGIVVVVGLEVVAYGQGIPPHWCDTAAAAEAWALLTALSLVPFPPRMRTDCLVLIRVAQAGLLEATKASRPLARIWGMIGTKLDGNIETLADDELLAWMPAHQTLAAIGTRRLSNGKLLTAVDWRANRLVDVLAKQAAATREAPRAVSLLLKSAQAAVRHASALLGRVTVAANHHEVSTTQEDGTEKIVVKRDAQQPDAATRARRSRKRAAPKPAAAPKAAAAPTAAAAAPAGATDDVAALFKPPRPITATAKAARWLRRRRHQDDRAATDRRVQEIGAAAVVTPGLPTGAEKIAEVKRRVRARLE
jgi:endonuclease/exonuclease/phosphatase family metal-dependent hydrolase